MENLQKSLNEGAMDIMINDAIAILNYEHFYKTIEDYEQKFTDNSRPLRNKRSRY